MVGCLILRGGCRGLKPPTPSILPGDELESVGTRMELPASGRGGGAVVLIESSKNNLIQAVGNLFEGKNPSTSSMVSPGGFEEDSVRNTWNLK